MNKLHTAGITEYIRSPYTLIGAVIISGIIANLILVFSLTMPAVQSDAALSRRIELLKQQMTALENSPVPAKAPEQELENAVRQIPTQDELPRFMLELVGAERASGAAIEAISFGDGPAGTDPLAALYSGAAASNSGGRAPLQGNSGTPQQSKATALSGIEESTLSLQVAGSYQQAMRFMNQIYQMERFVNIKRWSVQTLSGKNTSAASDAATSQANASLWDASRENVRLTLKLSIYTAKGFADKLKGLPPLPSKDVDKRLDPTWNGDKYRALLQTMTR